MAKITRARLEDAAALVYRQMSPTPQHEWPLLAEATGARVWVKHENHTPTGSFKIRGGITFIDWLKRTQPDCRGVITATRGNHGQSQARAAVAAGSGGENPGALWKLDREKRSHAGIGCGSR